MDEAVRRVTGDQLAQLMFPRFDSGGTPRQLTQGMNASPGAAVGKAVFSSETAVQWADRGEKVILVRRETNPDDLSGMIAAQGVLTSRGGKTSHAAVVARGMGKTCVCGAEELQVDTKAKQFTAPTAPSSTRATSSPSTAPPARCLSARCRSSRRPVVRYFEGEIDPEAEDPTTSVRSVHRILTHADEKRRLGVRTNADTPEDSARARRFGAQGIGLCRTEHMFLGDRRQLVEKLILAEGDEERQAALDALEPLQKQDFLEIFEAMDGLPVTIRLLDPPLHEFLPDLTELSVRVAIAEERGEPDEGSLRLLPPSSGMHEQNPMLGLRGVRLGLVVPGLFAMQVRAIAEAACERQKAGGDPRPEIMIPLVGAVQELEAIREEAERVLAEVAEREGVDVPGLIGTMIEVPRAALTAGEIAEAAEFFSFGTNDLTQMTWGFSRDDVEAAFFHAYLDKGIFGVSPFESLDREGVGRLVEIAVEEGRAARPDLKLGVCGEHGGDPDSVHFFHEVGLDYVSCSPFRVAAVLAFFLLVASTALAIWWTARQDSRPRLRRDRGAGLGAVQRRPVVDLRGPAGARDRPVRGRRRPGDRHRRRQGRRRPVHRGGGRPRLPGGIRHPGRRAARRAPRAWTPWRASARCRAAFTEQGVDARRAGDRPVARHARRADGRGRRHRRGELADPAGSGRPDPRHPVPLHPPRDCCLPALPRDRRERRRRTGDRLREGAWPELDWARPARPVSTGGAARPPGRRQSSPSCAPRTGRRRPPAGCGTEVAFTKRKGELMPVGRWSRQARRPAAPPRRPRKGTGSAGGPRGRAGRGGDLDVEGHPPLPPRAGRSPRAARPVAGRRARRSDADPWSRCTSRCSCSGWNWSSAADGGVAAGGASSGET